MTGTVRFSTRGPIAEIIFDRPQARNAMTMDMYDAVFTACARIGSDCSLRVATLRGAGGEAFVAGTDIEHFRSFKSGEDGVNYERIIDACIEAIEGLPIPTIAIIEGWAVGGGLAIATACDFRIATPDARFGVPIARTLGNCLSMNNIARIVAALGSARVKQMLMIGDTLSAPEALACGFVTELAERDQIDSIAATICGHIVENAPLTLRASKEGIRRIQAAGIPDGSDLIRECYGSADFRLGVESFLNKRKPVWTGR
jgi:enoyl-CoA hydratase